MSKRNQHQHHSAGQNRRVLDRRDEKRATAAGLLTVPYGSRRDEGTANLRVRLKAEARKCRNGYAIAADWFHREEKVCRRRKVRQIGKRIIKLNGP